MEPDRKTTWYVAYEWVGAAVTAKDTARVTVTDYPHMGSQRIITVRDATEAQALRIAAKLAPDDDWNFLYAEC